MTAGAVIGMIEIMQVRFATVFENAPRRALTPGAHLFHSGDEVRKAFWLEEGSVTLARSLSDGGGLILHRSEPRSIVAEASLFASRYHCDAIAETDAVVAFLKVNDVRQHLIGSGALATSFAASIACEVQALRARVEILRLHRLSDRLDAYLSLYGTPAKGHWVRVADAIGVTPPALYRELGRRGIKSRTDKRCDG